MARRMVERMGHTTYTAENGKIAVDIIKEKEVALVLMGKHFGIHLCHPIGVLRR